MKRKDAFKKLHTICQRLDEIDSKQFPVIPLRLYLFGSLLTDKHNPSDIDLLFKFQDCPGWDPDEILYRLSYGKPLPQDQAVEYLRQGMKYVRVEFLLGNIEDWLSEHRFSPAIPMRVVWEPGLEWRQIIDEIESHPISWDPDVEKHHKYIQEAFNQISQEQGVMVAREWLREQV